MQSKLIRRWVLSTILLILILFIGRPLVFLSYHALRDPATRPPLAAGYANDASRMNPTKMDTVVQLDADPTKAESQLQSLVRQAAAQHRILSIAGAQHSMGGQTLYPGAILVDMKGFRQMQLDSGKNILTVGSGARWADIIPYLDKPGKSVAVMQSNNTFTVGGSISVNCHGWQAASGPIASTVLSFRLLKADGQVCSCSRRENPELFSLVLGGYGLFGIILDVQLKVVDNKAYRMYQYIIPADDYTRVFEEKATNRQVGMVYGRININPDDFMNEAILSTFTIENKASVPALKQLAMSGFRRTVFRSSAGSDYGKTLRWRAEKLAARLGRGRLFSRNQLINEPVDLFQNRTPGYSDILHEYFIPPDSVTRFIRECKKIIPQFRVDLLNITIRNVRKDEDAFLRYAPNEVFAFVMLFNQPTSAAADEAMRVFTQRLVDLALSLKGTYYLPYRLHASREQFYKAYPMAGDFFLLKKKYDPQEIFQNKFYSTYK